MSRPAHTGTRKRVRAVLRTRPEMTIRQIAQALVLPEADVRKSVNAMCLVGMVRNVQPRRANAHFGEQGVYVLTNAAPRDGVPEAIRQTVKPAGTWERRPAALLRAAEPFDGLGK